MQSNQELQHSTADSSAVDSNTADPTLIVPGLADSEPLPGKLEGQGEMLVDTRQAEVAGGASYDSSGSQDLNPQASPSAGGVGVYP